MSLSLTFFTFINAWWIMLFFVLPSSIESRESAHSLEYRASPTKVRWKHAITLTTLLAIAVTTLLFLLTNSNLIPVHDL